MSDGNGKDELRGFDDSNLYEVVTYTDLAAGTIAVLTPVTVYGAADRTRSVIYRSSVLFAFMGRPMPLEFVIPADDLKGAIAGFKEAARVAIEAKMEELRKPALALPADYPHRMN